MGMFDFLKPKKELKASSETIIETQQPPLSNRPAELSPIPESTHSNLTEKKDGKEEIELIINKIETLRLNYELLQEKIDRIEKMVKEMYDMAKS